MEVTKVAIVGLGTVGSGVARLLLTEGNRLARHAGRRLQLESVVVRDLTRPRAVELPAGLLSADLTRITRDPQIKVVAHLVGGLEPARTILLQLLESGKDVVTANKALLAEHGPELFDRARELGRTIAFEAAVAGGIPIIANVGQCLSANDIQSLTGILNGTCNFILSEMEERGLDYAAALCEAQRLGYAEADPTLDVDGSDATQKLAILAHLAFGVRADWRAIPRQGLDGIDAADLRYARELGCRIRLLGHAQRTNGQVELQVSPTLVRIGTPLAEVRGAFNAIRVVGDAVGPVFLHGLGAGQMPTASAVVADLIDTVVGRYAITFRTLELWSDRAARASLADAAHARCRRYLRLHVADRPGVMAEITGALGREQISIASVIQHEPAALSAEIVPLVIMTHAATAEQVARATRQIERLQCVQPGSVCLRVADAG